MNWKNTSVWSGGAWLTASGSYLNLFTDLSTGFSKACNPPRLSKATRGIRRRTMMYHHQFGPRRTR